MESKLTVKLSSGQEIDLLDFTNNVIKKSYAIEIIKTRHVDVYHEIILSIDYEDYLKTMDYMYIISEIQEYVCSEQEFTILKEVFGRREDGKQEEKSNPSNNG